MLTGSYTGRDGGLHPSSVAQISRLNNNVLGQTSQLQLTIYHDASGLGASAKRLAVCNLQVKQLLADMAAAEAYAITVDPCKGWKVVADPAPKPAPAPAKPAA